MAERPSPLLTGTLMEPWGQEKLQALISAAAEAERLPQSLLVHGPTGVGKRALGLWIAATLQCESQVGVCGVCRSCKLAARLEHPDIHLHFPMPRPKRASSRAKLREAIEKQRQERLARLREDPHAELDVDEVTGLYVAAVENIREQATRRPAMSQRVVFVIENAERMVPQSSSPEAANAFLKLLEEPPDFATIVLTTSRPDALLPTIRSRTAPLRVPPVSADKLARYLSDALDVPATDARLIARKADGAIGAARRLVNMDDADSDSIADRLLNAALSGKAQTRYRAAGEFTARGARSELAPALEDLRARLRDVLCEASGATPEVLDPHRTGSFVAGREIAGSSVLAAIAAVEVALEGVGRNLNPQSTVAVLLEDMSQALHEGHATR